jgi:hypothetical protein
MPTPRLRITDGIDFFDLLLDNADAGNSGLGVAEFKDDGYERNDALAEGRQPVAFVRDDIIENYRVNITASSGDLVIQRENELIALLEKGIRYWSLTSAQNFDKSVVYIEEKSGDETKATYSVMKKYKITGRSSLYDSSQVSSYSLSLNLIIAHGQRLSLPPNQSQQIQADGLHDVMKETSLSMTSTGDVLSTFKRSETTTAAPPIIGHLSEPILAAIRFTSVPIDKLSTIYDARLIVVAGGSSTNNVYVNQTLHDSDNSPAFSTGTEMLSRQKTESSKLWDVPNFAGINQEYESNSIRNQLQEVVNRSGWATNNAITCFLDDNLSPNGNSHQLRINLSNPHKLNAVWSEGQSIGQLATGANKVHFSNKYSSANITHIFTYNGVSFSSNLFGSSLPQTLPVDTTSKELYFGISAVNNGVLSPFSSLIFDITKLVASGPVLFDWEYYDGVSFTSISTASGFEIRDNTGNMENPGDKFVNGGISGCIFKPPSDFATTTVNGVSGYWIKLSITSTTVTTNPIQNNQQIYTVTRPFINTSSVSGSIGSIYKLVIENESAEQDDGNATMYSDRIIVGVKEVVNHELFAGYINCTDSQNGAGINVSLLNDTTQSNDVTSANGFVALHTSTDKLKEDRVQIKIQDTIAPHYYGSYNVYIRVKADNSDFSFVSFSYSIGEQQSVIQRDLVKITSTSSYELLNLGIMTINSKSQSSVNPQEILINIQTENGDTPPSNIYIYDIILMPSNIWMGDFENKDVSDTIGRLKYKKTLVIDSTLVNENIVANVLNNNNEIVSSWTANATQLKLPPNKDYRFVFLSAKSGSGGEWVSEPWVVHSAKVFATSRYLVRRGNS